VASNPLIESRQRIEPLGPQRAAAEGFVFFALVGGGDSFSS